MPDWSTVTTTYTTGTIGTDNMYTTTLSFIDYEEKFKEYVEKVDKHVDQLEEDIAFLNDEREQLKLDTTRLEAELNLANDYIKSLESSVTYLNNFTSNLLERVLKLEEKK